MVADALTKNLTAHGSARDRSVMIRQWVFMLVFCDVLRDFFGCSIASLLGHRQQLLELGFESLLLQCGLMLLDLLRHFSHFFHDGRLPFGRVALILVPLAGEHFAFVKTLARRHLYQPSTFGLDRGRSLVYLLACAIDFFASMRRLEHLLFWHGPLESSCCRLLFQNCKLPPRKHGPSPRTARKRSREF